MSEVVVFPEQFSFDVRIQRSSPKRRLTIKNMGIMAAKITVTLPQNDAFIVTDSKGKTMCGTHTISLGPSSDYFLFIQKKPTVGIVPEDVLIVTGGIKNYKIALRPAVSMVSMQELESVAGACEESASEDPLLDAPQFSREDFEHADTKQKPQQPIRQIPKKTPVSKPLVTKPVTGGKRPIEHFVTKKVLEDVPVAQKAPLSDDEQHKEEEDVGFKGPERLADSPKAKASRPRKDEEDVLTQSLRLKFSFKADDFLPGKEAKKVHWYENEDFEDLEEPEFAFELMMTGEGEEPVFCIDGEYYDPSGRLLSVQRGGGRVICVGAGESEE
jgi:hypothetical protein